MPPSQPPRLRPRGRGVDGLRSLGSAGTPLVGSSSSSSRKASHEVHRLAPLAAASAVPAPAPAQTPFAPGSSSPTARRQLGQSTSTTTPQQQQHSHTKRSVLCPMVLRRAVSRPAAVVGRAGGGERTCPDEPPCQPQEQREPAASRVLAASACDREEMSGRQMQCSSSGAVDAATVPRSTVPARTCCDAESFLNGARRLNEGVCRAAEPAGPAWATAFAGSGARETTDESVGSSRRWSNDGAAALHLHAMVPEGLLAHAASAHSAEINRRQRVLRRVPVHPIRLITDGVSLLLIDLNGTQCHRNYASQYPYGHDAHTDLLPTTPHAAVSAPAQQPRVVWIDWHALECAARPCATGAASAANISAGGHGENSLNAPQVLLPLEGCEVVRRVHGPTQPFRAHSLDYQLEPLALLFLPVQEPPQSPSGVAQLRPSRLTQQALESVCENYLPDFCCEAYPFGVPVTAIWSEVPLWAPAEPAADNSTDSDSAGPSGVLQLTHSVWMQLQQQQQQNRGSHAAATAAAAVLAVQAGGKEDARTVRPCAQDAIPSAHTRSRGPSPADQRAPHTLLKPTFEVACTYPLRCTGPLVPACADPGRPPPQLCRWVTVLTPSGRLLLERTDEPARVATVADVIAGLTRSAVGRSLRLRDSRFYLTFGPGLPGLSASSLIQTESATLRLVRTNGT